MLRAAFVTGEADSGEEEGEAPDGAGLLLLAGLSMIPRRRRGMSLGPLSANPANIPRLAGNAPLLTGNGAGTPLLTGNGAGTPLLTDGGPLLKQILKTDAPHLNAELAARLATKEGGPDYAKRLDAISLLSENGNAGRGAAGRIDASAISGGLARRGNVSPNKPVTPIDDSKMARVTGTGQTSSADWAENGKVISDGLTKLRQQEINMLKKHVIDEGQMLKDIGLTNKQLGPAIAGAYDSKTGRIYTAINDMDGAAPKELHPIIEERMLNMPPEVLNSYAHTLGVSSHAEVYAANKALLANPNANISDIAIYVNKTLGSTKPVTENPFQTCPHCKYILQGFNIISDI